MPTAPHLADNKATHFIFFQSWVFTLLHLLSVPDYLLHSPAKVIFLFSCGESETEKVFLVEILEGQVGSWGVGERPGLVV